MVTSASRRAAIVGGGICGLSSAIALHRQGWNVTVFEETEHIAIGAGITIWSNGITALKELGIADDVRSVGSDLTLVRILDEAGRELMRQVSAPGSILAMHRRDLNAVLMEALPTNVMHALTPAVVVDPSAGIVEANGHEERYDLVVAADGVHSRTRLRWWPEAGGERDCGIHAWRAVVAGAANEAVTVWGRSGECGILPLPDGTTYVFGASRGRARAEGLAFFANWVEPVPALLDAINDPIVHDLTDLDPVRRPVKGRTVLVGDAAHAMRPHLGQGAGLSIEDAVVLGRFCTPSGGFDGPGFTAARWRRWGLVSWLARRATTVMMPSNRASALVHSAAPYLPDRLMLAAADRVSAWRP